MCSDHYLGILGLSTWAENILVPLVIAIKPVSYKLLNICTATCHSVSDVKDHCVQDAIDYKYTRVSTCLPSKLRMPHGEKPLHRRVLQLRTSKF